MNRNRLSRLVLLGSLVFVLVLMLALEAPGWAAPSHSPKRQTVPTLVPRGYLPMVMKNF